ncbi:MAG: amidohydrolase [Tenericutes bacterium GWC2_34_14]|nr:MAG: amidohydrolase [Tenericutes bacterium GWC2_34_14]OHE34387.1 MAG: amidohydrolase [Tenericutes bacterium GWE2_34_108]OHE35743.1 MAG: amidohydrolase [Tenericutes bacterium GWF1_35_14]OHE39170.1 MAG: amidohydrolase [Tenericutes bacterium GWF2_35_184]OHE42763.1 MAG: amidohydrolase [Tenericutes bacterium RIFOXYA2_FULL_36_32]OHE44712.1 MAG: amidohydrolase [Tenericutes bacterium RIFOXYA12_FULL_35_10]OHE45991.1 MAG: amidohydrolase [Tenericutes bacterium RIFOXYB2_FULL_36_25]OHE49947.1 MAG: ami
MNDELKTYRRDLHQIPELGFDLNLTSAYIYKTLVEMGYHPISMAKTGWVIQKKGKSQKSILFRTDMDALPVFEQTDVSFQSRHQGKMHACGHDGHMSMMLGFAKYVSSLEHLNKSVVMIFQPAEEGPGGAKVMIDEGLFQMFEIEAVYGIHLYPGLEEGLYGLVDGPMMAQNGEFDLVIKGESSHGAMPHLGTDTMIAAAQLIQGYQSIISRNLNPLDSAVITVGTIRGGEARNIIAKEISMSGTVRAFKTEVYEMIKDRMHLIESGIEKSYDVIIHNDIKDYYPPVTNDHHLFTLLKDALPQALYKIIEPMTVSEDFAFYQKHVPGVFVMLGSKNEKKGYIHPLHSSYFNFDESILEQGVKLYQTILKVHHVI